MTTLTESGGGQPPNVATAGANWEPVKAFAVFLVIQVALVFGDVAPFFDGSLADPDAYMRLNRVQHLWDSGAWFDPVYPRIGAPEGHVQHWTRPMDVLLLVGAALAAPFVGFSAGLHWWGVIIGPVMLLPSLIALVWAAKPLARREWLWLVGVLFVTQPAILVTFLVGRPDHNCLLILLFILYLGLTIRLLMEPDRPRMALLAGAVAGLALWVSVETLLFVVAGIAAPGVAWMLGFKRVPRAMAAHAVSLVATLVVALLLERGFSRLLDLEFDQTSIAHLGLFVANLAFWIAVLFGQRHIRRLSDWPVRMAFAGVLGAVVLAILWVALPGFFESPLSRVDPLYRTVRLVNIEEIQPILRWSDLVDGGALTAIGSLFLWLGAAVLAIPFLLWKVISDSGDRRPGWIVMAVIAAIFFPLSCLQVRWVAYTEAAVVIPYACAVGLALDRVSRLRLAEWVLAFPRALLVSLACVWTFGPAAIAGAAQQAEEGGDAVAETGGSCPLSSLAAFLAEPDGLGGQPRQVMAFVDFGPELLYRTPHSVYSIPNHRFQPGFTATYEVMTADSTGRAADLIRENGVELIVVCPDWPLEDHFYGGSTGNPDGFYRVLAEGTAPDLLRELQLPDGIARHFRLYSVAAAR